MNTYGLPGLIETPTAEVQGDGALALTFSAPKQNLRTTVTFQLLPSLSGSFRYAKIEGYSPDGTDNYDRSFDLRYQIVEETDRFPALALGLRDFLGTGIYAGEYLVATKYILPNVKVTGGLGWGRLAGNNGFSNPLKFLGFDNEERTLMFTGTGGQLEASRWFQGPAAFLGGVDWQVTENLSVQLELSQDRYVLESIVDGDENSFPFNAGLEYRSPYDVVIKAFVLGAQDFGVQFSYMFDPRERLLLGGREAAPTPILPRGSLAAASWNLEGFEAATDRLQSSLGEEGLRLEGAEIARDSASVRVANLRWDVEAQAAGRTARVLANTLQPSVEEFTVIFQERGVPVSAVTTRRDDLEDLQYDYDADWRTLARANINDGNLDGQTDPKFEYSFGPYTAASFFDPQSPIRIDLGAQFAASYRAVPGLTFDARLRYPLVGNLGDSDRESDSVIPRVRSETYLFARESELEINQLTAEYIWRPALATFARVSAGYLENQYGGVSSEVLWSPIDSRLALGAEVNYVKQRDFDMLLGFQNYDLVTGHASAYYDLGNGFHTQVDVGRYLAGDWGGTLTVKREFNNGVKVGGHFTLTDVPFDDFGEGSFDKGLTIEIPLSFFNGQPSRRVLSQNIQPVLRDGGARLNVQNRLYPLVRDYRGPELSDGWARYLR